MYGQSKNDWRVPRHRPTTCSLLRSMERKVGKYRIEANGHIFTWSWYLLPSLSIAFDEVGFYIAASFLCFTANLSVEDEIKEQEWNERIGAKLAALTDTEEDEGEDDSEQFSLN